MTANERGKVVDELGAIAAELAPYRAKLKREEALKSEIRGWAANVAARDPVVYAGTKYEAHVSACWVIRWVDVAKAFKVLGVKRFFAAATIAISKVEEVLSAQEYSPLICSDQSGPRTVQVAAKPKALKKAA